VSELSSQEGGYRGESSRLADQVVGPAGPTSWPNGLSIFLVLLYFTLKKNIHSFGAPSVVI